MKSIVNATSQDTVQDEVVLVLERFLAELEAGRSPDRNAWLEQHPHIAEELAECLDGLEFLRRASEPVDWPNPEHRLGEFRLLRVIGRGGMGTVYEAEDRRTLRRVAVKILPPATANETNQKRFQHEIRAAASLDHPHIVPIETVGQENDVHYFSMKLIEGGSLAEWSESVIDVNTTAIRPIWHRERLGSTLPQGELTTSYHANGRDHRWIAGLMLQAADALAYAHTQGIVHRDIKPANLLLEADRHLWVADFGLAYVPGVTRLTQSSAMVGTLRYMAPEQIDSKFGAVDHRADQYGLGATFYELLAGRPIYPDNDRGSLITRILNDEPRHLRAIEPKIPRELETIVHKLLAKNPSKRYSSMSEVVADLQRFLDGRPVQARLPTAFDRAADWMLNHQSTVAMLLCFGVLLLVGMIYNQSRLVQERDKTRFEREEARRAVDDFWTSYSERVLDQVPEQDPRRREFLQKALGYYNRLAAADAPRSTDRLAAAIASRKVALIHQRLGQLDLAHKEIENCIVRLESLLREQPNTTEIIRELAISTSDRGNFHRICARWNDASRDYRIAATHYAQLIGMNTDDPFDRAGLAGVENNQGLVWASQDRTDDAIACFRAARARFAELAMTNPVFLEGVASASHNLAEQLRHRGSLVDAMQTYADSVRIHDQLLIHNPVAPRLRRESARTRLCLAELQSSIAPSLEPVELAWSAVLKWQRLAIEYPEEIEYSIGFASAIRVWSWSLAMVMQANEQSIRTVQEVP